MQDKNDELARLREIERKKNREVHLESEEQELSTASLRVKNVVTKKQLDELKKRQAGKFSEEDESLRILGEEVIKSGITEERMKKRGKVI